jgi:eukaryotic-like serine/threonine-protein kinase
MSLTPGSRIGVYQLVTAIGKGGMGEVYRARDTKLQRDVAIKVLPDLFARDPERLARFAREARTLAALNHPHIAQVYGVEDTALIMEFVDGEDLSQRISQSGRIPIEDALPIALQIAEAIEAAHEQGIIHRDLKPANIKVRPNGTVKVLDFGLAKAFIPPDSNAVPGGAASIENSPTITSPFQMSQLGVILGTAAYMAPEQAKGKPLDKRVDIWAFGCVLYEMLTGQRPFAGEDVTDTLAAIVRADPDWAALPPDTPPSIRRLLRRCLEKDRRERLPDIGAARLELKDARADETGARAQSASEVRPRAVVPWLLVTAAALAVIAIGVYAWSRPPLPDTPDYRSAIIPPAGLTVAPVRRLQISPDGRRLAFVAPDASGRTVLWVRPLNDVQALPLVGTGGAGAPFWSPDSQWIGFQAEGKLKKIAATGGTVTTLSDAGDSPPATWNRDDVILFTGPGQVLLRVPAGGGPPVVVTRLRSEAGERIHLSPFFLPDGRHFLYSIGAGASTASTVQVGSLDGGEPTRLLEGTTAQYANGHILFLRGSTLMAQRFDPDRLALSGDPVRVAQDIQINLATGTGAFSVSQTGVLVFQSGPSVGTRLTWLDRAGKPLGLLGDAGPYADVQLSPDGKWASATRTSESGHSDVWLFDIARNLARRFTFDAAGGFDALWVPGPGTRLAYASRRDKAADLFQKPVDGTGEEEVLLRDGNDKYPVSFSPDGRFLLYSIPVSGGRGRLWILPIIDRKPFEFLPGAPQQSSAEISPDGRWIAYVSVADDGMRRVYVASFPEGGGKREIFADGGETPRWRADGKELYFTQAGKLMAVDMDTTGLALEVGRPQALFEVLVLAPALGTRSTYAVSRDGQRFLFNTWDSGAALTPITLVVNWPATLRR